MKINDFVEKYIMHDSLITSITNDKNSVRMIIDFAFWMQPGFSEGSPETGPLEVDFLNATRFECPENIPLDQVSILKTSCEENTIRFSMLNDITNEYFEIVIEAESVSVK